MASPQFQIPPQEIYVDPQTIEGIDSILSPAEITALEQQETDRRYEDIKKIEQDIEALRKAADEDNLPQKSALDRALEALTLVVSKNGPKTLDDRLVDAESEIGGQLFAKEPGIIKQRFWYHENDWFYEVVDAQGAMVARYQFTDGWAYKLVDGRAIAFAEGEEAALVATARSYFTAIQTKLYPNKADYDLAI